MQILQWECNIGNMLTNMPKTAQKNSFIMPSALYAISIQILADSAYTWNTFDKTTGRKKNPDLLAEIMRIATIQKLFLKN